MAALFNFLLFYSLLSIGCSAFLIYHDPKMWKDYVWLGFGWPYVIYKIVEWDK